MGIAKIITASGITVMIVGDKPFVMAREHRLFNEFVKAVNSNDEALVKKLIEDSSKIVSNFMKDEIAIINGQILYKGTPVHGVVVDRILQAIEEQLDPTYLINFLNRLMKNPSMQSRNELYLFLEACGDLPITEDGRFIAYKWVRDNYLDVHSGTNKNTVGAVISMPRSEVNDDRRVTCSYGLHVCSSKYYKFGDRLMLVAVDPADVVSVPNDYDNGKMRVCKYEVVGEIPEAEYNKFTSSLYTLNNSVDKDEDDSDDEDYSEEDDDNYPDDNDDFAFGEDSEDDTVSQQEDQTIEIRDALGKVVGVVTLFN